MKLEIVQLPKKVEGVPLSDIPVGHMARVVYDRYLGTEHKGLGYVIEGHNQHLGTIWFLWLVGANGGPDSVPFATSRVPEYMLFEDLGEPDIKITLGA
jgi:hypothetical protein